MGFGFDFDFPPKGANGFPPRSDWGKWREHHFEKKVLEKPIENGVAFFEQVTKGKCKMLSYSMDFKKLKHDQIRGLNEYNSRTKKEEHQISDKKEWFHEKGNIRCIEWNQERLDFANSLSKRKDAVEAFSFIFQVGNQTDWREDPTPEFPSGKPKPIDMMQFKKISEEIKNWAIDNFGKENLIGLDLHLDESSPHFHLVVTPIKNNVLSQKLFIDKKFDLKNWRNSSCKSISSVIPCKFDEGSKTGGKDHDQTLSSKAKGAVLKVIGKDPLAKENERLKEENRLLLEKNARLEQAARQRQKGAFKRKALEESEENLKMERTARIELQKTENLYYELKGNVKNTINAEVEKAVKIEKDSIRKQQEEIAKEKQQLEDSKRALQSKTQDFDRRATDDPKNREITALKGQIQVVTRERDDARESAQAWKAECEAARPERRL